jgi:hypothetical protein
VTYETNSNNANFIYLLIKQGFMVNRDLSGLFDIDGFPDFESGTFDHSATSPASMRFVETA